MHTPSRIGVLLSLIAVTVLWVGCDSSGTGVDSARPAVQFSSGGTGGVPTDSIVEMGVTLTDSVGAEVSVEVLFAAEASSASLADVGSFGESGTPPKETVEFPETAGPNATETLEVNIAEADLSEGSKEAFFALQGLESEGNVEIGSPREFSLSIGAKPMAEARTEAREALQNDQQVTVTVRGTVTRAFGAFVRFQDDTGPTGASGLAIRQTFGELSEDFQQDIADGVIEPGTELLVSGSVSQFSGLLQINNEDLGSYDIVAQGEPPAPQLVSLGDIMAPDGEEYMSELLRVEGLSFPNASGSFESGTTYTVEDEEGTSFEFRVQDDDETNVIGEPIPDGTFDYEGVLGQFNVFSGVDTDEGYQFIPVQPDDIQPEE